MHNGSGLSSEGKTLAKKSKRTLGDHSGSLKQWRSEACMYPELTLECQAEVPGGNLHVALQTPLPWGTCRKIRATVGPLKPHVLCKVLFLARAKGTQKIYKIVFEYLKEHIL